MLKLHSGAIFLCTLLAAANQVNAQAGKARVRIGSADAARTYASFDCGPAASSMVLKNMSVVLKPGDARRAELEQFVASQQDPTSRDYHRWLTPEEYAERFGVSDATMARVAAWLTSQGMSDVRRARGRMFVSFSGNVARVASAFNSEIHEFDVRGVRHFANIVQPSVPAELKDAVVDVSGLNDFTLVPQIVQNLHPAAAGASSAPSPLGPGDLAAIYGMSSLYNSGITGKGVTVAVVGQTPIGLSDYRAYRQWFGLPAKDFEILQAPGTTSGTNNPVDVEEATLDVEIIGGVAPDATVLYVWGSSVNWALQWTIDEAQAQVISESYAGCEGPGVDFYQTLALQANAEGITWVSAAGDSGAAGCDGMGSSAARGGYSVEVPASAPSVTAVGGTAFGGGNVGRPWSASSQQEGASALSYVPETGWSSAEAVFAGGGGLSSIFGKPGYQSDFYTANTSQRMVPDVSFAASPVSSPYAVVLNGSKIMIGGTSAATPLFSGIVALVSNYLVANGSIVAPGLGNINPTLYRLNETAPSAFHDVATGSDDVPCAAGSPDCSGGMLGYPAETGYDLATGLGSVDAYRLASNWSSATLTPTTAKLSISAAEIGAEQNLTMTVTVDSAAAPVACSPVQFYFTDPTNNNQPYKTLLATVPTDNAGVATYSTSLLPLGVNTIEAVASGSTSAAPAAPVSSTVVVDGVASATAVIAAQGTYQVGQTATLNVQVSVPAGRALYGPDRNAKYYYGGAVSLFTSNGVLVAGPVVPDETGAVTMGTDALAAGKNTYYATYSGNFYVLPSKSATLDVTAGTASEAEDFQIEGPSSIQVAANENAKISLQIVPASGFNQTLQLSCSGLPPGESCSLPANVTPTSAMEVVLTIAPTSAVFAVGFPGCLLLLVAARRKRRLFAAFLLVSAAVLVSGCLGKNIGVISLNAASQTYPVTIKATSGSITHQLVVNVTISR